MKLRLTPLNILSSALLVAVFYLLVFKDDSGWRLLGTIPLIVLVVISFVSDIIFRTLLKGLKRIWIVELLFIIFAVLVMMIIQSLKK
ncbi:hypothetical protein [Rubrolithibacter danxiaensis]|uniref:hypothetical protein n=1 Tax=Rubrolithibacter danxiaensis TaxID=3390805 RepID=UPI003BF8F87B